MAGIALLFVLVRSFGTLSSQESAPPVAARSATLEETRALLLDVLVGRDWGGRLPLLVDRTLCFAASEGSECESADRITRIAPGRVQIPQILREFLVATNAEPGRIDLTGIPGGTTATYEEVRAIFDTPNLRDAWASFYEKLPLPGYVRISRPVISADRQALIYVELHCGALCGNGTLYYLERSDSNWKVVEQEMLWIS